MVHAPCNIIKGRHNIIKSSCNNYFKLITRIICNVTSLLDNVMDTKHYRISLACIRDDNIIFCKWTNDFFFFLEGDMMNV